MAGFLRGTVKLGRFFDVLFLQETTSHSLRCLGKQFVSRSVSSNSPLLSGVVAEGASTKKLFVTSLRRGLEYTNEEALETFFSDFGEVEHVELIRAKFSDQPRGSAIVTFKEDDSVRRVLECDELEVERRQVKVSRFVPREKRDVIPTCGIYVSDVSKDTSEQDIKKHFSQFGDVQRVVLPRKSSTRERRSFCFVIFSSVDEAKKALADPIQKVASQDNFSEINVASEDTLCLGKTKKVGIEPVPSGMTVNVLQEYCEKYGRVLSIDLLVYASTYPGYPTSSGTAYVYFNSEEAVEKIISNTIHTIGDTEVCVIKSPAKNRKQYTPNRDCKVSLEGLNAEIEDEKVEEHFEKSFGITTKKITYLSPSGPCLVDFWKTSDVERVMEVPQQTIHGVDVLVRRLQWNRRVEEGFLRHKTPLNVDS